MSSYAFWLVALAASTGVMWVAPDSELKYQLPAVSARASFIVCSILLSLAPRLAEESLIVESAVNQTSYRFCQSSALPAYVWTKRG